MTKQILVYYIPRGDKFEETKESVSLSDEDCEKANIVKQIFFPIDSGNGRIETIPLK